MRALRKKQNLVIGLIAFVAMITFGIIKSSELNLDKDYLQTLLEKSYLERGISSSWLDDELSSYVPPNNEQIAEGISTHGHLILSAVLNGTTAGELTFKLSECPREILSTLDPSLTHDHYSVDISSCREEVLKLQACTVSLEEFVQSSEGCISSLGAPAAMLFSKTIPNCLENLSGASCKAYSRIAAQLTFVSRALKIDA